MDKKSARIRRATRARRKLQELGATRLVVHRTPRHIYAQVIAPNGSEVLVAASTVEKAIAEQLKYTGNKDAAAAEMCIRDRTMAVSPLVISVVATSRLTVLLTSNATKTVSRCV